MSNEKGERSEEKGETSEEKGTREEGRARTGEQGEVKLTAIGACQSKRLTEWALGARTDITTAASQPILEGNTIDNCSNLFSKTSHVARRSWQVCST